MTSRSCKAPTRRTTRTRTTARVCSAHANSCGSTAECRLLLWFTDGLFDVGPDGKDPGDAPAVINGVCASESGVADWFQDSNVLSYVILSNDWDINKWERQFTSEGVLEASLSVMQAITGHEDLDEGKIGKKPPAFAKLLEDQEYEVDAACLPYTQGRAEEGEVLLNAGDLDDIFDVLMAEILGDTRATPSCPSSGVQLVGGGFLVESNPLPDGLFVEEVKIFNLNGEESTLSIFALPADGSPRQTLRLVDKAIDSSQLKQFAAGWRIAVEGPGDMEICIFSQLLKELAARPWTWNGWAGPAVQRRLKTPRSSRLIFLRCRLSKKHSVRAAVSMVCLSASVLTTRTGQHRGCPETQQRI